jgi:hypothetical protein
MIGMQLYDINKQSPCMLQIWPLIIYLFLEYLFAPLDFAGVPLGPSEPHFGAWTIDVPIINGNTWLGSRHLAYFMDYVVENNIVYE